MEPIGLLNAGLPQTFNLCLKRKEKKKNRNSLQSAVKRGLPIV